MAPWLLLPAWLLPPLLPTSTLGHPLLLLLLAPSSIGCQVCGQEQQCAAKSSSGHQRCGQEQHQASEPQPGASGPWAEGLCWLSFSFPLQWTGSRRKEKREGEFQEARGILRGFLKAFLPFTAATRLQRKEKGERGSESPVDSFDGQTLQGFLKVPLPFPFPLEQGMGSKREELRGVLCSSNLSPLCKGCEITAGCSLFSLYKREERSLLSTLFHAPSMHPLPCSTPKKHC